MADEEPLMKKMQKLLVDCVLSEEFGDRVMKSHDSLQKRIMKYTEQQPGLQYTDYVSLAIAHSMTEVQVAHNIQMSVLTKFVSVLAEKLSEKAWREAIEIIGRMKSEDVGWRRKAK